MKKISCFIIILFSMVLIHSKSYAQGLKDGDYFKNDKLDKFVGTWQWVSGDSSLTIILIKTQFYFKKEDSTNPDAKADIIIGWHEFSVKNVVIESSLSKKRIITTMQIMILPFML